MSKQIPGVNPDLDRMPSEGHAMSRHSTSTSEMNTRARQYAEQLDAHMDEGGTYSPSNVRDLISFILDLTNCDAKASTPGRIMKEALFALISSPDDHSGVYGGVLCNEDGKKAWLIYTERQSGTFSFEDAKAIADCEPKASGWRDIESAPKGVPIVVKIGDWVGTVRLNSTPKEDWTSGDEVLHYPGATLVGGFRASYDGWLPAGAPLPPPPGQEDGDDFNNTDTIYRDAHRASVRSTIETSMKREEALRAENAELMESIEWVVTLYECWEPGRINTSTYRERVKPHVEDLRSALSQEGE